MHIARLLTNVSNNETRNQSTQENIKVREWISHIGLISKVIPLKLFLDIVPSSSEDVTRAIVRCVDTPSDFLATT